MNKIVRVRVSVILYIKYTYIKKKNFHNNIPNKNFTIS